MSPRLWVALGALLVAASVLGLAAGSEGEESAAASVENAGPSGTKVLFTWLRANGAVVSTTEAPFDRIDAATVVLVAPTARSVSAIEVDRLRDFVERGGTLVVLAPRAGFFGSPLAMFLGLSRGEALDALSATDAALNDPMGMTAKVELPALSARGVRALRVLNARTVLVADAVAVTTPAALWFKPLVKGEVWVAAGPDLAQNARLDLLDNAKFWLNLGARGPMLFDEFHHHAGDVEPLTVNLVATALQFMVCAVIFVWARGVRLGPPRPTLSTTHRSSLEYVRAMAGLITRAKAEDEVVEALRAGLKRTVHEHLGLAPHLPLESWVREVARSTGVPEHDVRVALTSNDLVMVGRAVAAIEQPLRT